MIKHINPARPAVVDGEWRNLGEQVSVELTSEDPQHPIERALVGDGSGGWRADAAGPQAITLTWPGPIAIRRIRVVFEEHTRARTQEFVLRAWTRDGDRDIVRQQFTFAPPGTTVEREDYATNLDGVTRLELAIVPAIDGGDAVATLQQWRVA
jgi:hypothetical protein